MKNTKKLTLSAIFLALGLVMPFLTMQIPEIGSMMLPMHIPVLICGFVCGWKYGLVVGFIVPLLRSLIFSMPPLIPAIAMAFELATYGAVAGTLYYTLKSKKLGAYVSLNWQLLDVLTIRHSSPTFKSKSFMEQHRINGSSGCACNRDFATCLR